MNLGQEVVCIDDRFTDPSGKPYPFKPPQRDCIYTVSGFDQYNGMSCISLREFGFDWFWEAEAFRPLQGKQQDYAHLIMKHQLT